jgi:hypothetical protein
MVDELHKDDARRVERHVDVPYRTGAAILGEMKGGGVEPFGDVAGLVDAQKEEGHGLRTGALQGRQAVAGLVERNAVDVIGRVLGGVEDPTMWCPTSPRTLCL